MSEDVYFFKFRHINKNLIDSLVNETLFFAHPDNLNDPFDCRVDLKKAVENAVKRLPDSQKDCLSKLASLKGYIERVQNDAGNAGICSFSLELENSLMWSHYANDHKGICLTYDFPRSFLIDESNEITGVSAVTYGENTLSDWLIQNAPDQNLSIKDFSIELIKQLLTIKSVCWSYEKEVRIIRQHEGTFKIPKEFLKQVCFGLNTPTSDVDLIQKLLNGAGYSVAYCKIERSDSDFGLTAKAI